ncbi:membrane-anchored ubiquitin-fold protein 1 isoform X2 [Rosa chinensis]|uniref:membrane-anchored ubiquitin-fold protein 1 isoform X2 n=1 Tax=Rosa chinensis TaxID=74649 RepID=UPI001AD91A1B|nr:membrane-anchored ubiquitin-fold protein 1 isoform X2 [Rosa chinensis]XP_040369064.1 membrane-anchored ubiquitin-fold protein 1 isoform X2 [Rosa chinensis]
MNRVHCYCGYTSTFVSIREVNRLSLFLHLHLLSGTIMAGNIDHGIQALHDKENGPRTVKDVKLISAGKILENNRTVGECRSPICDVPTTMHVVVQPPSSEKEKKMTSEPKQNKCVCVIL